MFLARGLLALGHDVHCYCNPETSNVELPGATFHHVRTPVFSGSRLGLPLARGSFALAATRALRRDRAAYDIIDVCGTSAWEHDVITVHGVTNALLDEWWDQVGDGRRLGGLRRRLAPLLRPEVALGRIVEKLQFRPGRFKRIIAPTEQVKHHVVAAYGVPLEVIDVIPCPVDVVALEQAVRDHLREELGIAPGATLLLFVGSDFERKGLGETIAALQGLESSAHLVVVGQSAEEDHFRAAAAKAGVADRVHFVGGTETPERYYANADLLVLPTKQDPWGIPLIEAMAARIPVVTTRFAGAATAVSDGQAGVVLSEPSVRDLREALAALIRDPALRKEMGERGAQVAGGYSIEAQATAAIATYELAFHL